MTHPANVITNDEARAAGWKIVAGLEKWETVCKAVYEDKDEQIAHVTKRLEVRGGYLYEVATTRYVVSHNAAHEKVYPEYSHAKALTFVPSLPLTREALVE